MDDPPAVSREAAVQRIRSRGAFESLARALPGWALVAFRRNPLEFLLRVAREQGDVARFRFGPQEVFLLSHPDLVKDVFVTRHRLFTKGLALQRSKRLLGEGLLTSEGELHLRQRRLVQPAFHRERVAAYGRVMVERATRARGRWRDGETLDAWREMSRLTLAIVGETLYGADVEEEAEEVGEALTSAIQMFELLTLPFFEVLERLPLPQNRRFLRARRRLDATILRMIAERRGDGRDRGDLLSMLLLARDVEGDGGRMTDVQVRDEAMTLFLAGHETTAVALTWTWYLLSQNPDAEARLHEELDRALGDRLPRADDVPRLEVTRSVFAEAMRLYPPAWVIGRRALADVEIDGRLARRGTLLLLSPWVVHHDPRWWADPWRFDLARWTPEAQAARPRFAYFPFGGGPRICIGEPFAWMEGVLVLATLAQEWRLRPEAGHPVEPRPLMTLRPKQGMRVRLERRARPERLAPV